MRAKRSSIDWRGKGVPAVDAPVRGRVPETRAGKWRGGRREAPGEHPPAADRALIAAEDAGWDEVQALVDSLTPEQAERPGY